MYAKRTKALSGILALALAAWGIAFPRLAEAIQYAGVNLSGAEFGTALPGTFGTDYTYPNQNEVDYFKSRGMNIIRLPFLWERLQHTNHGAFDTAELGRLTNFVAGTTAKGVYVLLDPHNYARYYGNVIGSTNLPVSDFTNLWWGLAGSFRTNN